MRELIWLIILVLFGYVVFQVVRAIKIKPAPRSDDAQAKVSDMSGDQGGGTENGSGKPFDQLLAQAARATRSTEPDRQGVQTGQSATVPGSTAELGNGEGSPWSDDGATGTDLELRRALNQRRLRNDVEGMQLELADARRRITDLETCVGRLQEQIEAVSASQGVSPEYNEALVFARRGLDGEAIAERCGISVAEAELVRSLAQRSQAGNKEEGG